MRFKQIMEMSTVAGGIAPVAAPLGATQTRENVSVKGLKPVTQLKSKSKNKGPYANSVNEGKVKELSMDLKSPPNGLSDAEFLAKYKKSKADMRASLKSGTASKVNEADLSEADLIVVPGQGKRLKPGFIPRAADRTDREVEMAKGDLFQAAKNAKAVFDMVKDISEDDGLEGWVQEKIVKAADYLNTLREYFESKQVQETALPGGVIAGGMAGESRGFRSAGGAGGNALEDMDEAKRPERQAPSTSLQVGNRVVADLRKEKNYPGTSQYRSGIVSRVGEKGVHIKPDDGGEAEWHPYKIVKKLGVAEGSDENLADLSKIKTDKLQQLHAMHRHYGQTDPRSKAAAQRGAEELKKRGVTVPVDENQGVAEGSGPEKRMSVDQALEIAKKNNSSFSEKDFYDLIVSNEGLGSSFFNNEVMSAIQKKEGVAEGYPKHQDLSGISTDKLKAYLDKQSKQQVSGEGNQVKRVRAELQRREQGVAEGAKVDRMVQHVKKSEKKLGHSAKEAENIAWATANKRGMLDNKNKKK